MIIYTDMVADLFHYGHVRFLKRIKEKYPHDKLIVGIHSDNEVAFYKRKPVMSMLERVEVIKAIKYVDNVIENAPVQIDGDYIKDNNIELVIHAHREDEDEKYNTMYEIPMKLNIFERLDYTPTISTTNIINRLRNRVSENTI